jgi:Bacterial PH domain
MGVHVAGTEQRLVLHDEGRKLARVVGYPVGLFLVVAAVLIPPDERMKVLAAILGPGILMLSWSSDRRLRIEVTEQNITVVNIFSRDEIPWSELTDIKVDYNTTDEGNEYYLEFVTRAPIRGSQQIRGHAIYGTRDEAEKDRARILRTREPSTNDVASDAHAIATEDASDGPQTLSERLVFALVVALAFLFGFGIILIFVLDAMAGDWLIEHVPFWDELIGFYEWLGVQG